MSIVTTFESQCRALTSVASPDENASRFLVGTLSPTADNYLHLFEYKDENNSLAKVSLKFAHGESWHLSASNRYPNLVADVVGNRGQTSVGVYKLPNELNNSIEDDYGLSDLLVEETFVPLSDCKNLSRQTHWHPDDSCQLLTCNDGCLEFWDIEQQKQARSFSITRAAEKALATYNGQLKSKKVSDFRWSSLFNCSVIAAAMGPQIIGIDMRIPESSPASICWLIEDGRCNRVLSLDFNPNSQYYIASGGDDCRANFWDLRQTSKPALTMQTHSHWIWAIRYNPFHDQLVLSAGSDARVVLMRAQSIASEPYGQAIDEEDEEVGENENREPTDTNTDDEKDTNQVESLKPPTIDDSLKSKRIGSTGDDDVINIYEEHDDSIYAAEWATDPWVFASLGFESRLVVNKVPKAEKFNTLAIYPS